MRKRSLSTYIEELTLEQNKMVFISGPRQAGKTTLAKSLLASEKNYFNWDHVPFRKKWLSGPDELAQELLTQKKPRIVLDEFHKNKKWKNQLKGFFDQYGKNIQIIITGSANLNTFRKGADSLLGRFFHFHLLPFTLGELLKDEPLRFSEFINYLNNPKPNKTDRQSPALIEQLLKFGGFPEPFEKKNENFHQMWKKNRIELLIRQDLKELSNIFDIGHVEILASFLPDRVGSPLSVQSLKEDLDVAHTTVSRWLMALTQVYYHFAVRPYSKSIARSLKKEPKIYLYDWSDVENPGSRFENMVAAHLLKMVHFYNDTGQTAMQLHYLRDKDGNEVDFLITNKSKPLFSVEAKLSLRVLDTTFEKFQKKTKVPHFQIINESDFFRKTDEKSYVIGFDQFFSFLP